MELLSPAHLHQYAPYRRAEELESRRPFQHVDRRPAVEQDCPYRTADAVTDLFVRASAPRSGVRAAIKRGKRRIDGTPARQADLALDQNATVRGYEIRTATAKFVPLRVVLIPGGGLSQLLLVLRLVILGFGGRGAATRRGGDNTHCLDKSPPR